MKRLLVAAAFLVAACGGSDGSPGELTGVIVDIESASIEDIESFTLRSEGETYEVFISDDVQYGFPLSHLNAHLQAGEPVTVELEDRDGRLVALSIEDAPT